ncbi:MULTISPECIES: phosphatase PAP2 family protein [unclassified Thioalkalivibrio]|uniref:phosphatase PAP2 family protein n=1 Tax=unclassified Thioalkalivibrio TaxID=2621013 RepID=UPI000365FC3F|nr:MULTISPECIES: phosphatase PAP2 family protein [unclassified Thioalkalivibrio]
MTRTAKLVSLVWVAFAAAGLTITASGGSKEPGLLSESEDLRFADEDWSPYVLWYKNEVANTYLSKEETFTVDPPPRSRSVRTRSEINDLVALHSERTEKTLREIAYEDRVGSLERAFSRHGLLDHAVFARPALELARRVSTTDGIYFVFEEKKRHARPRPRHLSDDVRPVIDMPGHPAYPSGHAAQAHIIGLILSEIDPDHAEAYMGLARDIGIRREIAGVHYRSDTLAGIDMAEQVFERLMEHDQFQSDLASAEKAFHDR